MFLCNKGMPKNQKNRKINIELILKREWLIFTEKIFISSEWLQKLQWNIKDDLR